MITSEKHIREANFSNKPYFENFIINKYPKQQRLKPYLFKTKGFRTFLANKA